jgi:hypothetical protein
MSWQAVSRLHLEAPSGTRVSYQQVEPLLHLVRREDFDAALFGRAHSVCTVQTDRTIRRCAVLPTHVDIEDTTGNTYAASMRNCCLTLANCASAGRNRGMIFKRNQNLPLSRMSGCPD